MAYQDTGKHVVAFMILALVLSFAALIALWAMGAIPTTSYPQIIEKQQSPARLALIIADAKIAGSLREHAVPFSLQRIAIQSRRAFGRAVAVNGEPAPVPVADFTCTSRLGGSVHLADATLIRSR